MKTNFFDYGRPQRLAFRVVVDEPMQVGGELRMVSNAIWLAPLFDQERMAVRTATQAFYARYKAAMAGDTELTIEHVLAKQVTIDDGKIGGALPINLAPGLKPEWEWCYELCKVMASQQVAAALIAGRLWEPECAEAAAKVADLPAYDYTYTELELVRMVWTNSALFTASAAAIEEASEALRTLPE